MLYRELDIFKPGADPQWRSSYHCTHNENSLLCRGRIHTTSEWKTTKRGRTFQWGIFKNINHNHDPNSESGGKPLASTSKCDLQDREKEYNAGSIGNYEAIYESTQVSCKCFIKKSFNISSMPKPLMGCSTNGLYRQ